MWAGLEAEGQGKGQAELVLAGGEELKEGLCGGAWGGAFPGEL